MSDESPHLERARAGFRSFLILSLALGAALAIQWTVTGPDPRIVTAGAVAVVCVGLAFTIRLAAFIENATARRVVQAVVLYHAFFGPMFMLHVLTTDVTRAGDPFLAAHPHVIKAIDGLE